jgi:hypothetical protein
LIWSNRKAHEIRKSRSVFLHYSKVREITRVADSGTEAELLLIATHGTADHVQKMVCAYRRAKDAEELTREALQQAAFAAFRALSSAAQTSFASDS